MAVVSLNLSFASPLFYFSLGIFVALYALMVLKRDHKKKISEFESNSIVKFYLNIFVQNKEEALSNVIKAKMANKFIAGES
jgi:phosphomannomutase